MTPKQAEALVAQAVAVAKRGPTATVRQSDRRIAHERMAAECAWCTHGRHDEMCMRVMRDESRCRCTWGTAGEKAAAALGDET